MHGEEGLQAANRITQALFSGDSSGLSESDYQQLAQDGLPSMDLDRYDALNEIPLTTLLVDAGMASSGKQIKDALQRGAVVINGDVCSLEDTMKATELFSKDKALHDRFFLSQSRKEEILLVNYLIHYR